jgi:Tol biopolymer transport system component
VARVWRRALAVVGLAMALVGCGNSTGPQFRLDIAVAGRLERSAVVDLAVELQGAAIDDTALTWAADPEDAVEFLPGGRLQFLSAGSVELAAEAEIEGRLERGRATLDIAVPPPIVFDLLVDGNRDIYVAALDGGDLTRLTQAGADDLDPTAAAGTVVFTSFGDGNGELYSIPLSGGTPVRLTETADDEIQPSLSNDGARIAYTYDATGVFKLWTADVDGNGAAAATADFGSGGSIEGSPSWAPSGDRLVFMSTTNGTADLFDLLLDGSDPVELIAGNMADVEPAWGPDGAEVVFVSNRTGDAELWLYRLGTQELVQLTDNPGSDGEPAWLPDGRIVYTSWVGLVPELRWLDPAQPEVVHEIALEVGEPRRPSGVLE